MTLEDGDTLSHADNLSPPLPISTVPTLRNWHYFAFNDESRRRLRTVLARLTGPSMEFEADVLRRRIDSQTCPVEALKLPEESPAASGRPAVYSSAELLQGLREAWIEHGDQMYRLRLTHAGKLYLTK